MRRHDRPMTRITVCDGPTDGRSPTCTRSQSSGRRRHRRRRHRIRGRARVRPQRAHGRVRRQGSAPGAGSTSASSSIIRFSYSTLDAVLTAWEAAALWSDWAHHLGADRSRRDGPVPSDREPDLLHDGIRRPTIMALWDEVGIPYERFDVGRRCGSASPGSTSGATTRPSASTTRRSPTTRRASSPRSTTPTAGSSTIRCSPPTTWPTPPPANGAEFRFRAVVTAIDRAPRSG